MLLLVRNGQAQKQLNPTIDRGPKSKIQLIKADSLLGSSGENQIRTFYGDVQFLHQGVLLKCRKAIHNSGSNKLTAYGFISINQGDTLTITGDTLYYDGDTRFARILGKKVVLTDDEMTLTSRQLNYNLKSDMAYYPVPGIIIQDSVQLSSKEGFYNTATKIFNYFGDVEILHPDMVLCTDSLDYNRISSRADFNSFTTINSTDGILSALEGYYYTDSRLAKFYGDAQMENELYSLEADTLDFNMQTKDGFGIGNVAFFSKEDSLFLHGDFGEKFASQGFTKIIGNTLMRSISGGDTLYLSADFILAFQNAEDVLPKVSQDSLTYTDNDSLNTIIKSTIIKADSLVTAIPIIKIDSSIQEQPIEADTTESEVNKIEFIIAHGHVKIYRNDFQSKCDSLNYNLLDSNITFIGNPMIWSTDNQLEGDTITVNMVNNKIKTMFLNQNSFVISQDSVFNYNQIKGREIITYFDEQTNIKLVDVNGNGESIYYALDDNNRMIGLNRVECSRMRLSFENRKVKRISFLGNPESKLIPPKEINQDEKELDNFSWEIDYKPSKEEVLGERFEHFN